MKKEYLSKLKECELFNINNYKFKVATVQFIVFAIVLAFIGFTDTLLYYFEVVPNNFIAGYMWPGSMLFLLLSIIDIKKLSIRNAKKYISSKKTSFWSFILILTVIYFVSHFYNFSGAPWNSFGLFDDAAWDIYDSRLKCFNGNIFEIIFFDGIGSISRELLFHYFIAIFMRVFGYNLLVFNVALILIGYVTVLFTGLIAYELFNSAFFGLVAGVLLNFYPLHFTQVFMGHRYAICAPLIVVSVYYLLRAYKDESTNCSIVSGLFAGFAMSSAIMGKQYIWALECTLILLLLVNIKNLKKLVSKLKLLVAFLIGYCVSAAPLYAYIWTHKDIYTIREDTLKQDFFERLSANPFGVISEQLNLLKETLFASSSGLRQFSADYPILTWYILVLLIIGIAIALYKKNVLPILLVAIPVAGNCITIPFDFRLLIIAPFVMILVTYSLNLISKLVNKLFKEDEGKREKNRLIITVIVVLLVISPTRYLMDLARNPNSQRHLPHYSVAVARFIQDIVVGDPNPDVEMHSDEFNRPIVEGYNYDVLAAPRLPYAHVYAYLYNYDAYKILSFGGNFPYESTPEEEIRSNMLRSLNNYGITDRGLKIVVERSEKMDNIMALLTASGLGTVNLYDLEIDGVTFHMYVLVIENPNIQAFIDWANYSLV